MPNKCSSSKPPCQPAGQIEQLREATRPVMVQVAPGRYSPTDPTKPIPNITLAAWIRNEDGTYRPSPVQENFVRINPRLIRMLGFEDRTFATLRRLGNAGFIELIKAAPHCTLLNLTSWYNHLRRCAEDPEFWEAGKGNLEEYRRAL
jgi:hypothetical protein